jgi:hypothetical protein
MSLHSQLWEKLREEGAEAFCRRTGAELDAETGCLTLAALNGTLVLNATEERLEWGAEGDLCPEEFPELSLQASAINYLLSAKEIPLAHKWIGPQELPEGEMFLRGPHGLPVGLLEEAFGERPEAFAAAALALGGGPLTFADLAYEFQVFPRVKVAVLLWRGDDEFPARARFLVDETMSTHLAIDAVLAVTHIVTDRLIASA